ncbi:MAG: hypothetical protein AABY87_11355 [bacterium]
MDKKNTKNTWVYNQMKEEKKEMINCLEDLDELERFHEADLAPVQSSEHFKNVLREKLWKILRGKSEPL